MRASFSHALYFEMDIIRLIIVMSFMQEKMGVEALIILRIPLMFAFDNYVFTLK